VKKILIVDDNAENLDGLREILEIHGYGVMTAANGAEALDKANSTLPDMIITDVLMPVMDGFTLCKKWKQDEVFKTIPLIFYSGDYIDPKDEKFGLSLGAEKFIMKPANMGEFIKTIQKIIEEYHNTSVAIPHENNRGEEVYLKEYNEALIRRLEDKMLEIERVNRSLEKRIDQYERAEKAMRNIAEGVSAAVGEEYFYSLVEHLSLTLKSDYAYIAEVDTDNPGRVRTLALIGDGKFIDNLEVDLAGTPCDTVSRKVLASYPSGVQQLFPGAQIMAAMSVEGYIGTKLTDSSGNWLGLMSVMYREPVKNVKMVESILKIFAARAAAEIERRQSEEALRRAKSEIEKWNKSLEQRVKEKTEELIKSQAQLIQAEKLSVMGQMAAGLAHELNSPLAGLLPLIERYKEKADKDSRDYLELSMMLKAGRHMAKVVRDFGTFSREPKGEFREISVNEVIDDTLVFSGVNLKKKRIKIVKDYSENLPKAKGDKTELQQVVLNMVNNAGDAMCEGGQLTITTSSYQDDKMIRMEFADCGSGIEKEHLGKIFEPFFTTKEPGEGTGLGLSVSFGIISNHKGEISVESEYGKGAKFIITLPAVNAG